MPFFLMLMVSVSGLFSFAAESSDSGSKGFQVMQQAEVANNGFIGEAADMKMILINAHGDKVTRKMSIKVKEVDGDGDKSIITFLWPADVNGTKMLTWAHKTENDDQWIYLPALKRVKRITSTSKTGSFMGSEFSYEDLGSKEVERYTYKYLKDYKLKGRATHAVERVSKDSDSGYSREIVYLDKEYQNPLKIEYYDRKNELLKVALFSNFKKIGKFWRYNKIHIKNLQTQKSSILIWEKRKLLQKFPDTLFNQNRLKI